MKFSDPDEAQFVADQLAEVRDSMGVDNDRAARLIVALDAEAPDAGVLMELMVIAGERLAQRAGAGDEEARSDLETLLRIVAGLPRGETAEKPAEIPGVDGEDHEHHFPVLRVLEDGPVIGDCVCGMTFDEYNEERTGWE